MMLRIIANTSAGRAKTYFSTADYYTEGQELVGLWHGAGATRLGLAGTVEREDWDALCDNRHPETGTALTPRRKSERRVGYDFNFHVPKSVSLLYGLTRDERILQAFRDSVEATMEDLEAEMQTRVRARGKNTDRITGNMVWGEFIHFTARPVDGIPDPHLHAHCFVFNTTWDAEESRWKAGQFGGIKRDGEFFEAVFHSRLARRLEELGLPVERTKRGWELRGVPATAMKKFSRRTELIEERARAKGITDPEAKSELGAKTREQKAKDLTMDELREQWTARLTPEERAAMQAAKDRLGSDSLPEDDRATRAAVARAVGHSFERSSVVPQRKLLANAMKQAVGVGSPTAVQRAVQSEGLVIGERMGRRLATTRAVLAEERRMTGFARDGRGTCRKLGGDGEHEFHNKELSRGQVAAVLHVLNSRDRVMVIRGGAGTGKTTMMREAIRAMEAHGNHVFTFAPSADASRGVLRDEGFGEADTVARLLSDPAMQTRVAGSVLWIDEAGLLGTRTMAQVFELAQTLDCRIVLSGDRRQHGSVERGTALRLLEQEAGLKPADVREIQRQKGEYKSAVQALSEGRLSDGFRQLDGLGWIREADDTERYKALAAEYVATATAGKTALVVSPTHLEGGWITDEIRAQLRQAGRLKGEEHQVPVLMATNLTEAERSDSASYEPGDVVVFHQNAKGHRKGDRVVVGEEPLPLEHADKFQVFRQATLPLAAGDLVRITRNGMTADGRRRLNNGAMYTVAGFTSAGDIRLSNGWTLAAGFGHLSYGYVVTSHASQGKTVDRVFIGQSSNSLPAASREQFYVSISRGREMATVYTDDKVALLDAVTHSDERLTATELVDGGLRARSETLIRANGLIPPAPESRTPDRQEELHRE